MGKTAGPLPYSDSRLKTLQNCLRQYYYTYINRKSELEVLTPNMFKGLFLHRRFELSWVVEGPGKLRQRYRTRESFVNSAVGNFKRYISKTDSTRGLKIEWEDPNQKWKFINGEAKDILSRFYHNSQAEGPPLAVEVPLKVRIDGEDFIVGVIDEVRRKKVGFGLIIRDHKYYPSGFNEMHASLDPQLTIYLLVLTADLASYGPITRNYLGLLKDEARKIANLDFMSKNISLEYHLLKEDGRILNVSRKKEHYLDFKDTFLLNKSKLDYAKRTGNYAAERGQHCTWCSHRYRCAKETLEEKSQLVLIPKIESLDIDKYFIKRNRDKNQTKMKFPKKQISLEI